MIDKIFLASAAILIATPISLAEEHKVDFTQATSFDMVQTEAGVKGIVLFEACGTDTAIASNILQNLDPTALVSQTENKGAVVGENNVQQPDWILTATVDVDEIETVTNTLKTQYQNRDCSATMLVGDYIAGSNLEPSLTDPQGLWAADLKYLKEGMFPTFRDYLVEIQPLYDDYGFEGVARIINLEKVDLAEPITNLDIPDIATMTYIANFRTAFPAYRQDDRFPPLRDKRATTLNKYVNFTGMLEPKAE